MFADYPSIDSLEKVLSTKGRLALLWYACRLGLRKVLIRLFNRDYFGANAVYYKLKDYLFLSNLESVNSFIRDINLEYQDFSFLSVAKLILVDSDEYAILLVRNTAFLNSSLYVSDLSIYNDLAIKSAFEDLDYINGCETFSWVARPLWNHSSIYIKLWQSDSLSYLKSLNLDLLAYDLNIVWSGGLIGNYAKNYKKNLSDIIINDPIALRRAILGEETEQIQAVRLLLLGSGGAGKSSLADRLQAKPIQQVKSSTQGIDYLNHQSLKLEEKHSDFKLETNDLDLYLWDFGGQTIFHGLHSAFLHENCVYVLVVDSRHEQAPDEWLYQIRHLAGNQANVLLITNEYENCKTQQNQKRLLREFPDLLNKQSFFYFSCLTPEQNTFKDFLEKLIQVSSESRRAIFKSTLEVRNELSARYQSEVFLNLDEVEEIIADKVEVEDYRSSTLNQLEQLGFIIPAKGEKYCLNPVWVVDNAYKLLYSDEVRNNHGIISLNAIRKILNCSDKYQAEILVRDLLQERALCCAISKTEYFFPDAASTNEPDQATEILENPILTLRFDVPYLPLGFHARLVHKLYNPTQSVTIQTTEDIWRQGFILKVIEQKQIKAQAVIHYLLRKSAIEMVFNGEVESFAALLETLYPQLEAALDTSAAQQKIKIQTLVSDDAQNLLAIPSGYKLIDALKKANTPNEIVEQVNKMTKENAINITAGAGSQIIIGDGNKQKANSNNTQQPASVVGSSSNTATVTPDTIKAERRQRLLTKLSDLYKQYDYETRVEEKMRIKALIDDTQQELNSL